MSLIITATDFSVVGNHAVNYACKMATETKSDITVVHSYVFPVMFSDVPVPASLIDDTQNDAQELMTKLITELKAAYPTINISGKVLYGELVDALDELNAISTPPWLIIVGDNTNEGQGMWLENPLADILTSLKYPVMAIPPGVEYKAIKEICFAFDNKHTGNDVAMVQLRELTTRFNADLHVLNAQTDVMMRDNIPDIDADVIKLLADLHPHYHVLFDVAVNNAIQNFIKTNKIELLVMIPRERSFLAGLFHKSHTKHLSRVAEIPVMALHENK